MMGLADYTTVKSPVMAGAYEYLLVAQPDARAYEELMAQKALFSAQFNLPSAVKARPHIVVATFMAFEAMEDTIIRWMARVISNRQRFPVTLKQYGTEKPQTIYLEVADRQPFTELVAGLSVVDQYIQGYGCPGMRMINHPHLTIARKLDRETYRQAMELYAAKHFETSFPVKELVLLRRRDQFDTCRQVNVFGLKP